MANLLRASLAWALPGRGGALLHAAGIALDGRAFVLVGPSGSGKTTWARVAGEAGAVVLSDDLVMVDGIGPRLEALGAPFRSTLRLPLAAGRWPLAAILFPRHGARPSFEPCSALLAKARVTANLTFIADAVERDERVAGVIERLTSQVACADLAFAPDPSFLNLLRRLP